MPCTQWAISATEILSLATVLHQWQSQGQIKTSVLVPCVEHHWRTPCVSYEVSSRTEPQFPIVTSCSQIIYFLVAYLLVYLVQFCAPFTVSPIIISQTNNLHKSLTQSLFPGIFNLIHIIKGFFFIAVFWNIHYNDHTVFNWGVYDFF